MYETPRVLKLMETERRRAVPGGWGEELLFNWCRVSVLQDEKGPGAGHPTM